MAHRVISDGNWPKSGPKDVVSGANGLHIASAGNNRRGDANSSSFRDVAKLDESEPPHDRQTDKLGDGGRGRYGNVGLYWWQLGGVSWGLDGWLNEV